MGAEPTILDCYKLGNFAFEQITTTALIKLAGIDRPQVNLSSIIHSTPTISK